MHGTTLKKRRKFSVRITSLQADTHPETQDRAIHSTASVITLIITETYDSQCYSNIGSPSFMAAIDNGFTFDGRAFSVFRKMRRMSQLFQTQIRNRPQQISTTESRAKHHVIVPAPLRHRASRGELPALLLFPTVTVAYHHNQPQSG
jgi:hypothetical protein